MQRKRKSLSTTIAEDLKGKILRGDYTSGEQLPAEIDLARELDISRATLRDALSWLELEGLVVRRHGIGSFVSDSDHQVESNFEHLESMVELIKRSGYEPTLRVIDEKTGPLDDEVCTTLQLSRGTTGIFFTTLYSANNIPFVYTKEYVPSTIVPATPEYSRGESEDLSDFIARNSDIKRAATLTKLKGILPTSELMSVLMIDSASPIIRQHFTLFDRQNKPIGCGFDYFNSSWFEFSIYTKTTRL